MLFKVLKKIYHLGYAIDLVEYEGNILWIKGWFCSFKYPFENLHLVITENGKDHPVQIYTGIRRPDVYQATGEKNGERSGFFGKIVVENVKDFSASLEFTVKRRVFRYPLGIFHSNERIMPDSKISIQGIESECVEINLKKFIEESKDICWKFPERYYEEEIDIVIPIYNGYQYLERLFETVSKTKMKYRLIVINDKSPDERITPFLQSMKHKFDNMILIENEENKGFVKNVNIALRMAKGHVALVNSDVELPNQWLERLMLPILENEKIASSTPYTNCGIITSFPKIGQDNELMCGLTLDEIDEEFQKIKPRYLPMPTGVGFCMGMNKKAIAEVGLLDEESFGKGYGEENDWCQRAIENGYKNIHVENLFVYHKHGGSFPSEDKLRYMQDHQKILEQKHPSYSKQVSKFFVVDVNKDIRSMVKYNLIQKSGENRIIIAFDHDLGGGATSYLVKAKEKYVEDGYCFYIIRCSTMRDYYQILYYKGEDHYLFYADTQEELFKVLESIKADEIWINELASYPDLYEVMDSIVTYARNKDSKIKMLLHDYFSICPTINLLDYKGKYCSGGDSERCSSCLGKCNKLYETNYVSLNEWRKHWKAFLQHCSEIVAFSDSSRELFEKVYGNMEQIVVIPHKIAHMPLIQKNYKTTDTLNIGLMGVLTKHKGAEIIRDLANQIEDKNLKIRIKLIGSSVDKIKSSVFSETGRYSRENIGILTLENDIDIFLIPSIWPETFSYTTEEIMKMGMPVMCFDIGAPAERVKKYEKGYIIPDMTADSILEVIKTEKMIQRSNNAVRKNKKILFIAEDDSFTTRYRVEHIREQLLFRGIASDRVMVKNSAKKDLSGYDSVVLYRVSHVKEIDSLKRKAHKNNIKVFYNLDDYIYDYDQIKDLPFMSGNDFKNYETYSNNIKCCMEDCDGYIVSTNTMKKVVSRSFPGKPVVINRNVASMGMQSCSIGEKPEKKDCVVLGYFSGTKTHNADFESIKDAIIEVMRENANVRLLVGGQIQLPGEFDELKNRIDRFDFVKWTKLPHLIARADINLMPLEQSVFHSCKSENKWMEAAFVHVPTIATNNEELGNVIRNKIDGIVCNDLQEWKDALNLLIKDEQLRNEIADAAFSRVTKEYTTYQIEQEVIDLLLQ